MVSLARQPGVSVISVPGMHRSARRPMQGATVEFSPLSSRSGFVRVPNAGLVQTIDGHDPWWIDPVATHRLEKQAAAFTGELKDQGRERQHAVVFSPSELVGSRRVARSSMAVVTYVDEVWGVRRVRQERATFVGWDEPSFLGFFLFQYVDAVCAVKHKGKKKAGLVSGKNISFLGFSMNLKK